MFELVDGGRVAVGEVAARRALDWAKYLRSHASRVYAAGEVMAENGARLIVERRDQLPGQFTPRDVQRKAWAGLVDRDVVQASIDMLAESYHCREVAVGAGPQGGRPSQLYCWNPFLAAKDNLGR